jgi:hypothetical protein
MQLRSEAPAWAISALIPYLQDLVDARIEEKSRPAKGRPARTLSRGADRGDEESAILNWLTSSRTQQEEDREVRHITAWLKTKREHRPSTHNPFARGFNR